MDKYNFISTEIKDLYIIESINSINDVDYPLNIMNISELRNIFENIKFVENNELKLRQGTLRGLTFQSNSSLSKLLTVTKGVIYNVVVDLRIGSETFGKYTSVILSQENNKKLYIPNGFANGYLVLSDEAVLNYRFTERYNFKQQKGIIWNDAELNIDWPIEEIESLIISERDRSFPGFNSIISPFIYEEKIFANNAILQPIERKDIELIRNWRNNENDNKVFFDNNYITSESQNKWYEKYENNISDRMFMIYCKGTPVGAVALYNIDYKNNIAEFGRLLIGDLNSRCKNIGMTAARALCEYGFNKLRLNKIILEVYKDNVGAFNLYKKLGFSISEEKSINNRQVVLMELYNSNKNR